MGIVHFCCFLEASGTKFLNERWMHQIRKNSSRNDLTSYTKKNKFHFLNYCFTQQKQRLLHRSPCNLVVESALGRPIVASCYTEKKLNTTFEGVLDFSILKSKKLSKNVKQSLSATAQDSLLARNVNTAGLMQLFSRKSVLTTDNEKIRSSIYCLDFYFFIRKKWSY